MPKSKKERTKELRRHEETRWIYEARLSGYSNAQVADLASAHFGRRVSTRFVTDRISKWLSSHEAEGAADLRKIEGDRLDRWLAALEADIVAPRTKVYDEDGVLVKVDLDGKRQSAIDRALKIQAQRAKLLGLDAPVQVEARVVNVAPVDLEMEELAREVRESRGA